MPPLEINNLDQVVEKVRKRQLKDRTVFDKSNKAFVSYIQAYSKHECHLLLRIKGNFIIINTLLINYNNMITFINYDFMSKNKT